MEQIKYYLDEHIHSAVAEGLRRRGVHAEVNHIGGRLPHASAPPADAARSHEATP